jgi:hypothetical protein
MKPAQKNSKQFIGLKQAAEILSVEPETLIRWNEQNILKATITPQGEIGYTLSQIHDFLKIKNQSENETGPNTSEVAKNKNNNADNSESFLSLLKPKFLEDEKVKGYLKSQVKQSLSFQTTPPPKKSIAGILLAILALTVALLTQKQRIQSTVQNYKNSLSQTSGQVLQASTSNLVLSGRVIIQTPLIGKQDVSFE